VDVVCGVDVGVGVDVEVVLEVGGDGLAMVGAGLRVGVDAGVATELAVLPLTVVWTSSGTLIIGACV
jgi:hypothetical protein